MTDKAKAIIKSIDRLFSDTSVEQTVTAEDLEEIKEHCDALLEGLI